MPIAALLFALPSRICAQAGAGPSGGVAQTGSASPGLPAFDVASVKPHKSEGMMMRMGFRFTPDGVSIDGTPLAVLLRSAFSLPDDRILNVPAWAKSSRFDIEAKVDPDEAPKLEKLKMDQRMAMLVPLLEERFGMKFHHETKDMEVYDLVVAKGGPKLPAAKPGEDGGVDSAPPPPGAGGGPPDAGPKTPGPGGDTGAMRAPDV